ncbi:MAG: long-chain fatty acid--CoA ligase [Bergeyella sp.]|nr:long-chain fatty acid--CoA ligase [Bergeyella sp.]
MTIEQLKKYEGIAIIEKDRHYTYGDLGKEIDRFARELEEKIFDGDVVCIYSDYSFKSIALFLALSQNNSSIIVPIVPTTEVEFTSKIKASSVNKILYFEGEMLCITHRQKGDSKAEYLKIIRKNQSGLVFFSSGTTGEPKVMVHNFSKLLKGFSIPKKTRNLRFLLFLLFDHIGGINTLLSCLNNGSAIVIPENRNPEYILQLIEAKEIQILPTSPTFLNLMLMTEHFGKYDLSSLKMITYGTERMPQALLEKLRLKIPKVKFLQTFGTSETGILKTESKSSTSLFFKIVDPHYEYRIEEGQLFLRSNNQVSGYLNQESNQFTAEGWFATGDLVETDDEGYLKIIGRINKVINVGGQKVLPKEIEDVINKIPGVIDTTVFSKVNAVTGQMVCAEVTVTGRTDKNEIKKEIWMACRKELDKYKVPSKIIIKNTISFSNRFKKR